MGKSEVEGDLLFHTTVHFDGQQTNVVNCATNIQMCIKLENHK